MNVSIIKQLVKPHVSYSAIIRTAPLLRFLNHSDCFVWLRRKTCGCLCLICTWLNL